MILAQRHDQVVLESGTGLLKVYNLVMVNNRQYNRLRDRVNSFPFAATVLQVSMRWRFLQRLSILSIFMAVSLASCKPEAEMDQLTSHAGVAELDPSFIIQVPHPANGQSTIPAEHSVPLETAVIPIPLSGDASQRNAEISGMAWHGDWLILLPQYPQFGKSSGDGRVFALPREDILAFINGQNPTPLTPQEIPFFAPGVSQNIAGFEGYEAVIFDDNDVYMTIEASPSSGMTGYLIRGTMAQDLSELRIDPERLTNIKSATSLPNKSDEALFLLDDRLVTIHEANGQSLNPNPVANIFNLDLEPQGNMPMASIEYRITDATSVDEDGRFWAINYFFPGEPEFNTQHDPLAAAYGQGITHSGREGVERLVEFQIKNGAIKVVDQAPLQLELLADDLRNWEGITRLEGYGFLLVTDKFPETILGFVPYP